MVMVSVDVPPALMVAGANPLVIVGFERTVSVAFAVVLVAPLVEVTVLVVLLSDPVEVAVTFTLTVHVVPPAMVPELKEMLVAPAVGLYVGLPQLLVLAPVGEATFIPEGNVSVKVTPLSDVLLLVLVMVMLSCDVELDPTPMVEAVNDFVTVGAVSTKFAVIVVVPPPVGTTNAHGSTVAPVVHVVPVAPAVPLTLQLLKTNPVFAVAVMLTVPLLMLLEVQVPGQLIPPVLLVTVPPPVGEMAAVMTSPAFGITETAIMAQLLLVASDQLVVVEVPEVIGLVLPSPETAELLPLLMPHSFVWPVPAVSLPLSSSTATASTTMSLTAVVKLLVAAVLELPLFVVYLFDPETVRNADEKPPVITPLSSTAPATTLSPLVVTIMLLVVAVGF